ncbi:prepilin peptidase [Sphingosinicellaceae bacterium]|nr:prepilin peptidase [Sphingosinicellaceae bacterium]
MSVLPSDAPALIALAPALIAFFIVLGAAAFDVARFEIPDWVSVAIIVLAAVHGLLHPGFVWWPHLLAPVLMFAFGLLAFSRGWLGGGDVKLMTALAGWSGVFQLPILFFAISLCGGVLAVVLLLARHGAAFAGVQGPRLLGRGEPLPYAVAIAGGVIWWVWATGGGPIAAL